MAGMIKGKVVEQEDLDFGVQFDDGFIYEAQDEEDAIEVRAMTSGKILVREVYITAWAELEE